MISPFVRNGVRFVAAYIHMESEDNEDVSLGLAIIQLRDLTDPSVAS